MNRHDYLTQLKRYLKRLPKEDYQDALDYFEEYFDDAGPENEAAAIAALGTPKEAAHDILINLYDKKTEQGSNKSHNLIVLVLLSILAAPIGIPLALALVALFITLLLLHLSFLLLLASAIIALFSVGIAAILSGIDLFSSAWTSGLLFVGLGITAIGTSLLFAKGVLALSTTSIQALISWIQARVKGKTYETI